MAADTLYIVENMLPLFGHEQAAVGGWPFGPNRHGVAAQPSVRDLGGVGLLFTQGWKDRPDVFLLHLVTVDGRPVGFASAEAPPASPDDVEFYLTQFFLMPPYRTTEVVAQALGQLFDRHLGKWEISVRPDSSAEQEMYSGFLSKYRPGKFREGNISTIHGEWRMSYRFNSAPVT